MSSSLDQPSKELDTRDENSNGNYRKQMPIDSKHYTINLEAGSGVIIDKPRASEVNRKISPIEFKYNDSCNDRKEIKISINFEKPQNNLKKLSFIRDEDDQDDEDENLQSQNDPHQESTSKLNEIESSKKNDKNLTNENDLNNDNTFRFRSDSKTSTNGCITLKSKNSISNQVIKDPKNSVGVDETIGSSEEVSNDDDDRFSESLDYDEDSVKGTPQHHSNNLKKSPSHRQSISSDGPTKSSQSSSPKASSSQPYANDDLRLKLRSLETSSRTSNRGSSNNIDRLEKPRIKSFISSSLDDDETPKTPHEHMDVEGITTQKKSYHDILKYFLKDACYFQIKSINHENVQLSMSMGVWATSYQNESRLNAAFRENRNVILIFSVQQSGAFQGFARMVSEAKPSSKVIPWILPERLSNKSLGGLIDIDWLCTEELSFQDTLDLVNSYNDNKPVKIARDGQQLDPKVGKKLCKLFPRDSTTRVLSALETLKRQASERKKTSKRYDNLYPSSDRRNKSYSNHPRDVATGPLGLGLKGYPQNMDILSRIGFPEPPDQLYGPFGTIIHHHPHFNPNDIPQPRGFRPNIRLRNHDQFNFPHTQTYTNPNFRFIRGSYPDSTTRPPNGYYSRYNISTNNNMNYTFHEQHHPSSPNVVMSQGDIIHRNHPYQRYRR